MVISGGLRLLPVRCPLYADESGKAEVNTMENALNSFRLCCATKAFWEHTDDLCAVAAWAKAITGETAFSEANMPLHKGAYRYYKEAGFKIPAHLVPND